ncbi:MAG: DNA alkylation repair protein [Planctomycetota bacterium]|nr:DNA alkylation repair protein [Planctomycetota bacterium]
MSPIDLIALNARKPACRGSELSHEVREALASGLIESKNLIEWLNVDRIRLVVSIAKEINDEALSSRIADAKESDEKLAALKLSVKLARALSPSIKLGDANFQRLASHTSDVAREWAALLVGLQQGISFAKKLAWIKPFADDSNPGVRELAWISLRADVIRDPIAAIKNLIPWTGSRTHTIRRYASEITRPRGVWAPHIPLLKADPQPGLAILEPLLADESKYVRNSVANWLNDAGKTHPDWVRSITKRWTEASTCKETVAIVKRATRNL